MNVLTFIIDLLCKKQIYVPLVSITIGLFSYKVIKKALSNLTKNVKDSYEIKKRKTIVELASNFSKYILVIIIGIIILEAYGIDTASIIAGLGVLSAVIGLAFQDTLKDFISGITIILENYYIVGDYITYNDFTGEVIELGLKTTKIKDANGQVMIIANRNINEIINISQKKSNVYLKLAVAYEHDVDEVENVIKEILPLLNKIKYVTSNSASYLGVDELADSSVIYLIKLESLQDQKWQVKRDALKIIKKEFDRNNIKIPYPQIEVHNEERL